MRFYTDAECQEWLTSRKRNLPDREEGVVQLRYWYPETALQYYPVVRRLADQIWPSHQILLWITEHGISRASENLHLYYRLRQTYHDHRLLWEAPGHLFLEHEQEDFITSLYLAFLYGWGGYISGLYDGAHFSHDEYFTYFIREQSRVDEFVKENECWFGTPFEISNVGKTSEA